MAMLLHQQMQFPSARCTRCGGTACGSFPSNPSHGGRNVLGVNKHSWLHSPRNWQVYKISHHYNSIQRTVYFL